LSKIFLNMLQSKIAGPGTTKSAFFRTNPLPGLLLCLVLLVLALGVSLATGTAGIGLPTVLQAIFAFDGSVDHQIVYSSRIPRALIALLVGGSLALAGALMQAITRNPLAAPNIMGVNSGAAFAIVSATLFLHNTSLSLYTGWALFGAAASGLAVYALGSAGRRGMTPLKLVIAGSTVATLLSSLTQGMLVANERTLDEARFWLAGSLSNRTIDLLLQVLPYLLPGMLLAFLLGGPITILSMGDDVAQGLGVRVGWIKILSAIAITLLAGASVALAGPVGFIGLVIPHLARALVGVNYRWILPYSAVLGGIFLLLADTLARVLIPPAEIPVGAITALVGAPVLIWIVRQKVKGN
jgi:iron complex transport system permease protein